MWKVQTPRAIAPGKLLRVFALQSGPPRGKARFVFGHHMHSLSSSTSCSARRRFHSLSAIFWTSRGHRQGPFISPHPTRYMPWFLSRRGLNSSFPTARRLLIMWTMQKSPFLNRFTSPTKHCTCMRACDKLKTRATAGVAYNISEAPHY